MRDALVLLAVLATPALAQIEIENAWEGKAQLSITRTRRVLRTITAPILRSLARSVVA